MSKLHVAVLGLGVMGRNHVRVLSEMASVKLVAVADVAEEVVSTVAAHYRVKGYAAYHDMLTNESIDAVIVAVPTSSHLEVTAAAIDAGLHVLVEKPIARDVPEGLQLEAAARRGNRTLAVGHIERFNPAVRELKRRLSTDMLGRILQVHARRLGPFPPRIRDVGVVIDLATHDLDVMSYLIGADVVRLYAETERHINTDREDMLNATLRFANGTLGVLDVNWLTPVKVREIAVLCEHGLFQLNYLTQALSFHHNSAVKTAGTAKGLPSVAEGDMIRFHITPVEPLRAELDAFVRAIVEGTEPAVGAGDGLRSIALATEILTSASRNEVRALVDTGLSPQVSLS